MFGAGAGRIGGIHSRGKNHIPGLRNDDVEEGVVLVAEAGESNPENHFGGCVMLFQLKRAQDCSFDDPVCPPQKF